MHRFCKRAYTYAFGVLEDCDILQCSKFYIFGIKSRKLEWRKPCTALQKDHLVPTESAAKLGLGSSFRFQHDNNPKHTAEIVKLWLLYNVPNQLHMPPLSPDLNPIEHLWDLLEPKICQHNIFSKGMLKSVLKDEWEKISTEETTKLVSSMPKRLQEVLERWGYPTSY
ncbi:transposable element Tcb2 transposase [Trichonephila clavipes]|nr:transposable element Tcb2 transposase [Trichonephila clavipes]